MMHRKMIRVTFEYKLTDEEWRMYVLSTLNLKKKLLYLVLMGIPKVMDVSFANKNKILITYDTEKNWKGDARKAFIQIKKYCTIKTRTSKKLSDVRGKNKV